ncbi:class II aldolase/adducin domain-containing protein [Cyathus striatus]|nr:class II aldolase/adducin domain-containing protein [Cyathus striatus]
MARTLAAIPKPPVFTDPLEERAWRKYRLAQAFRIFAKYEYDEGVAGHITVRDPIVPHAFWVNPLGLHFKLIQPEDLILVNSIGDILPESGPRRLLNLAAFVIHLKIHEGRPDVMCAAHSHSTYAKAYSTLGKPLDMLSQDSCAFYNDLSIYQDNRGIVFEQNEGQAIVDAVGSKKVSNIINHGALVATSSIEASVYFYIQLEKICRVQLLADAAASGRGIQTMKIAPKEAEANYKQVGNQEFGWFAGLMEFELLERQEGTSFVYKK